MCFAYNHFYCGKAIRISYPECVSAALVIQNGKRMSHIVIGGLSGTAVFFTDYCHTRHNFRKRIIDHKNVCYDFV
jgi:hypothetical protein